MPARRTPGLNFDAERLVEALTRNQADLLAQFERKLDAVIEKVEHVKSVVQQDLKIVQQDVRLEGHHRQMLAQEINQVQMQLGDLRDAVHLQKQKDAQQTVNAAVRAAAPAAASAAVKASGRRLIWPQWLAVWGVVMMLLVTVAEKAPPTLRFLEKTWQTWAGIKDK